jgi:hypothetical protein
MELCNETGDTVWHQGQVRQAQVSLGWWNIHAEEDGTYEFILRRWPEETGHAIRDGIRGMDIDPGPAGFLAENTLFWYKDGKAVDVYGAALRINEQSWYQDLPENAAEAVFSVELKKGPHTLRAWFSGGSNLVTSTVMSPYYISIRKK